MGGKEGGGCSVLSAVTFVAAAVAVATAAAVAATVVSDGLDRERCCPGGRAARDARTAGAADTATAIGNAGTTVNMTTLLKWEG